MPTREYARHALLGIAPPQTNPVVEAEMSALLPDGVGMLVTRLTGEADDARSRFYEYIDNLETSLKAFGKARIDAFGFAFTATASMSDVNQDERLAALSQMLGYPIISNIPTQILCINSTIGEFGLGNNLDAALALTQLTGLVHTVRESADSNAVFTAVAETAAVLIGHRLFTIMAFDAPSMQVQRIYSSDAAAYPPGVSKNKRDTQWGRQVLNQGLAYIGRDAKDIEQNFSDHEIILGLGLESILNIPIRHHGNTLGTMNLLNTADFYAPSDESWGHILAALLVGPLLSDR